MKKRKLAYFFVFALIFANIAYIICQGLCDTVFIGSVSEFEHNFAVNEKLSKIQNVLIWTNLVISCFIGNFFAREKDGEFFRKFINIFLSAFVLCFFIYTLFLLPFFKKETFAGTFMVIFVVVLYPFLSNLLWIGINYFVSKFTDRIISKKLKFK